LIFFCRHKCHKIENYFNFEKGTETKFEPTDKEIWAEDPGSGKPYSGFRVKKALDP
jgi:hypothetical protein